MYNHKQKTVIHPTWGEMQIDEKIADLIESLWQLDIMTFNSCQENFPGIIWIEFASGEDAERFLQVLFYLLNDNKKELLNIYERIFLNSDRSWKFSLLYSNYKEDEENYDTPNNFRFSISLRFPVSDYQIVLKAIADFLNLLQTNHDLSNLENFLNQLD